MSDPKDDDEAKFNETLKRMLDTKPKPRKEKDAGSKPSASRLGQEKDQPRKSPKAPG